MSNPSLKKRGRPKGAVSASLAEVRQKAAEEQRQLRSLYEKRLADVQGQLERLKADYEPEIARLTAEVELLKRREASYQQALNQRLQEMVSHLQTLLLDWGRAELEEAQIDKRKRGRPRKTVKTIP